MQKEKHDNAQILQAITDIENFFEQEEITISNQSQLKNLLHSVKQEYSLNKEVPITCIFQAIHISRINTALQTIKNLPSPRKKYYLHDLKKGSLDFFSKDESHAKNILFELEVASLLDITDGEIIFSEPDLIFKFDKKDIAIACKKVVSESNLKKLISKGANQIKKKELDFGIIAINIDNIVPNDSILQAKNASDALNILNEHVDHFIDKHNRHLNRKIGVDNIIGILIIASVITDLKDEKPRFNKLQSSNLYTTKSIPIIQEIAKLINKK